jgi:hypothetical protein
MREVDLRIKSHQRVQTSVLPTGSHRREAPRPDLGEHNLSESVHLRWREEYEAHVNEVQLKSRASRYSYKQKGWPTGLEPATFGATIRRHPFLRVAVRCRINLSEPIVLLTAGHCCWELRSEWCQEVYRLFTFRCPFRSVASRRAITSA